MEHTEVRRFLSDYLDGEVTPGQRSEIEAHLADCPRCRTALAELERTIGLVHGQPRVVPPPWLAARTMARIREAAEPRPTLWQRLFFPLRVKLPLEAAALIFICITGYYVARNAPPELTRAPSPPAPAAPAPPAAPPAPLPAPRPSPLPQRKGSPPAPAYLPPAAAPEKPMEVPAAPPPPPAPAAAPSSEVPPLLRDERLPAPQPAESVMPAPGRHKAKKAPRAPSAVTERMTPPAPSGQRAVLLADDPTAAASGAVEAVRDTGATLLSREATPAGSVIVVRLDTERLPDLMRRLERLGTLRQRPEAEAGPAMEITIRIEQRP